MGWCLLAGAAVAAVGCGSQSSGPNPGNAGPVSPAGVSATVDRAPAARDANSVVPQCGTSDLSVVAGPENAAAGTVAFPVVFTNNGPGPCALQGFPGVSYADGPDGAPVGAPAARDGTWSGPVRVPPGGQASALVFAVDVHNIPPEQCGPVAVPGLRIYPPDNTLSLYIARSATACGNGQVTTAQLRVRAVVPGSDGH